MKLEYDLIFFLAAAISLAIIILLRRRPIDAPRLTLGLLVLAGIFLTLSAGRLSVHRPRLHDVAVMIDRSASTRSASYLDKDALSARIHQLLGNTPFHQLDFSSDKEEQTIFSPPSADAIVLFSDLQFELPKTAPKTFIIVDRGLENARDAAVTGLDLHGDTVTTSIRNSGDTRTLDFKNAAGDSAPIPSGQSLRTATAASIATEISVALSSADLWPENDSLSIRKAPPANPERWWVGDDTPPAGWRAITAAQLPADTESYLSPSVIVLRNIPADAFSSMQQTRLTQFVRDLGGGLLITGGEQAFISGNYLGSTLESLSPLSSAAPGAQRQWVILVDSSGSMASPADHDQTRWQRATDAVSRLLSHLPPNDMVSLGSFARDLHWWSAIKSASAMARVSIPPADVRPQGPTNLQPALENIAAAMDNGHYEVILITDGEASIQRPEVVAAALKFRGARVHLLATGNMDITKSQLLHVALLTGGQYEVQPDPSHWAEAALHLAHSAVNQGIEHQPLTIQFTNAPTTQPARSIDAWNQTWIKNEATELAFGAIGHEHIVLAAIRSLGTGHTAAAAFAATPAETESIADMVAHSPRDPRFNLMVPSTQPLVLTLEATDGSQFLNELHPTLALSEASDPEQESTPIPFHQTGPGKYEASLPAPRSSKIATVRDGTRIIERRAIAGRYAAEFDSIGNNRTAMQSLAQLSGGGIIEPEQTSEIDFHWPSDWVELTSPLAAAGAICVALGLVRWKYGT